MELEIKKDLVSSWFKTLQDAICHSINDIENNKKQFISTNWKKIIIKMKVEVNLEF